MIASDPSGYIYVQTADERIWSVDTDGPGPRRIAGDLDEFVAQVIFGPGAAGFAGEEWDRTLRAAGL